MVTTDDYTDSFDDLADKLGTPSSTLRRYFKLFKLFIPNKTVNRATRFNKDALQTFEIINNMYKQRCSTAEILQELAATRKPTLDVRPSPPPQAAAPPAHQQMDLESLGADVVGQLIPLAQRFLTAYERQTKALEDIAAGLAANRPFGGFGHPGEVKGHGDGLEGQDKPQEDAKWQPVDKAALVGEVLRLRALGYGAARIRTTLVKAGWGSLAGAGHKLSKSTVAKIIKSNGGDK